MLTSFLGVQSSYEDASVVIIPAPYDATTTYAPGARFGPRAILEASQELELYDREFGEEVAEELGIHTQEPITVWDLPDRMRSEVHSRVAGCLDDGKLPFMLGGDHSLTLGAVQAAAERFPDLVVVQLDAHADLRDEYHGNPLNHACVGRRILEHAPLVQAGIRSLCQEEALFLKQSDRCTSAFRETLSDDPQWWPTQMERLRGRPAYLTVDVDVLDPTVMPATGTPEPDGLAWIELVDLIRILCREAHIVAADCVELMPIPGLHAPDFAAAKLIYKTIALARRHSP
jgi:agmatinase